jgi:thioester reductase-like protein
MIESERLIEYCRNQNIISERLFGRKEIILEKSGVRRSQEESRVRKMKPINEFLSELSHLDIKLWAEGDRLRCNAPKGTLTPTVQAQLKERKAEILQFLNHRASSTIAIADLKAEAVLDPKIQPTPPLEKGASKIQNSIPEPAYIFLTGATGFLGTFLLNEMLQQTSATLYCLVRSETVESAKQKLQSRLESSSIWDESFSHRIIPVVGDLAQPLLGFSEEQFQEMAEKIDVVYHNGAWVHHASPYSLLKATNVLGTQEVLRLACQAKIKPVHFISSLSVFNPDDYSSVKVIDEHDSIEAGQAPVGGYAQSKWVAEKLVTLAGQRGLPVSIYRLGPVSGHSQTGVFNVNDFLYRLILGYIQLKSAPEGEMILDIMPVDYATGAIAYLSKHPQSWGKAFHLIHPSPVSSNLLFEHLCSLGYPIERIPYQQWYAKLLEIAQGNTEHALYPLVPLFSPNNSGEATAKSTNLKFNCQNTLEGLAEIAMTCPPIDNKLLDTYVSYLIRSGFLDAPQSLVMS